MLTISLMYFIRDLKDKDKSYGNVDCICYKDE